MPYGDISVLTDDEKESVDVILKDYGQMEPYELRGLTHNEDPWNNARGSLPEGVSCKTVIPKEDMGYYYGSL